MAILSRLPFLRLALWLLLAALAAACSPPAFKAVDITGAEYARDFALESAGGGRRTLADYRGKVVVIFFGFTQCPDVCPTTLSDLAEVTEASWARWRAAPGDLRDDRPGARYAGRAVAVRSRLSIRASSRCMAQPEQTAATAKEFKIFYQKVPGKTATSYTMDHTAGSYVIDRDGRRAPVHPPWRERRRHRQRPAQAALASAATRRRRSSALPACCWTPGARLQRALARSNAARTVSSSSSSKPTKTLVAQSA